MRKSIRQFIAICAETLPLPEPIYEFGSLQVPGQEDIADLRSLFPGKRYVGSDVRAGRGVDVILDLHELDLSAGSVRTALCVDTMEHVEYPHKAVEELHRVLSEDGVLLMTSVMNFPIHEHPHDYWRFTPHAFESLLKPFVFSFVDFAGEEEFPHTVVGIAAKRPIPDGHFREFKRRFDPWKEWAQLNTWKEWSRYPPPELLSGERGFKRVARQIAPPIVLDVVRRLRRAGS